MERGRSFNTIKDGATEEERQISLIKKKQKTQIEMGTQKEGKDARKTKRIQIIKCVIISCFAFMTLLTILIFVDLVWTKVGIYESSFFIVTMTIIGNTLTTSVGIVIGSSID